MSANLGATYFNGDDLRAHPVTVHVTDDGLLHVLGEGIDRHLPAGEARISDRLGQVPFFLRLPERAVIELPCDEAAVVMLQSLRPASALSSLIHRLESHSAVAAAATLLLAVTVAVTLWQGLPRLALRAAFAVPVTVEKEAGRASYAYFARAYPQTELTYDQRRPAYRALERLKKAGSLHVEPGVVFFHMRMANAFALPGGTIVVTDELVTLAQDEDELAAVLAHELGHVEKRHGLQSVLRNSSALIVVSTVTGDLSTLSTFSGTLPFLLLEFGYSREFEHEADIFAVDLLRAAHIDPENLAVMLQRLEKNRPTSGPDFSYLSTHPATAERIQYFESFKLADKDPASYAARAATRASQLARNAATAAEEKADEPPHAVYQPPPVYPMKLREAGIEGEVVVDFVVGTEGQVVNAYALRSSRSEFEAPAVEALRQWKFTPGQKNGHPVKTHLQVPVGFSLTGPEPTLRPVAFVTTTSTIPADSDDAAAASPPDDMPYPIMRRPALYPESMRQIGLSGDVVVEFDVDTKGRVMNAKVVDSSHPDFDESALAAVRKWRFQPAVKDHRPVNAHMRDTLTFRPNDPQSSR